MAEKIKNTMKFIKEHLTNILLFLLLAIAVLLILSYIRKPAPAKDYTKELIAAKDAEKEAVMRERDIYRAWKDSTVAALTRRNDVLVKEYKTIVTKYEKVPSYINSLDKDSLRAILYERW